MVTELDRLREENELLRLRVDELEGILLRPSLPACVRLTRKEEQVLSLLLARPLVSRADLMTALYSLSVDDPPSERIIDIFILRVRRALKPHGIEIQTRWGQGWFLTNEDKERLRALP
ncbi:helix-turn-helix domain-containing protein [Xanthobacter tagetidis]|nr:helix-turn-helix domain-containing protein [Xanthobacter tagetidis]MBB6306245.1 two-component system cell cycle response regulator CtrA [Xanthobacter tagetidis]